MTVLKLIDYVAQYMFCHKPAFSQELCLTICLCGPSKNIQPANVGLSGRVTETIHTKNSYADHSPEILGHSRCNLA